MIALLLYYLDRIFPRPGVGGRESVRAYSEWEYGGGKEILAGYSDYFGSLSGMFVLDIGCGLGGKTVAYAEAGADVVGVDIEPLNVSRSADFAASRGCTAAFLAGDAETLPFRDATFDLVVANDSMEHFPHPEEAVPELARVLRPGGSVFLFFTPWRSPLGSHLYDYIRTPWCHILFGEKLLEEILTVFLDKGGHRRPREEARRLMGEFRRELNRMTIARYHRILESTPELETILEERKPPKFSFLRPFTRMPLAGEFLTGTLVGILRKRSDPRPRGGYSP